MISLYRGRAEDALEYYEQAVDVVPPSMPSAVVRNLMAAVLLEKNRVTDALMQARLAREEGGHANLNGLFFQALAYRRLGDFAKAEAVAQELRNEAELVPVDRDIRLWGYLRAEIALTQGRFEEAVHRLTKLEERLPVMCFAKRFHASEQTPIWFSLASAHLASGDESQAAKWFQRVAENRVDIPLLPMPYVRSFYFLGKIHENRGEVDQARRYYQRFLDFWKDGDMDRDRVEEALQKLRTLS
jgi:tetratricopeptide (TPR) repeat protein